MTADHGDNAVPGHRASEGENVASPRFDVVVRGYDRRQVDEHIAGLERTIARQRSELQQARESASRAGQPGNGIGDRGRSGPVGAGGRQGGPDSAGGLSPDMISAFTGRLQSILQAAEEEAAEVRNNARNYARKEEEAGRARLAELERRRESLLAELTRVHAQLDGVLSGATKEAPIGANLPPGTPGHAPSEGPPPRAEQGPAGPPRPEPGKRVEQTGSRPPVPERPRPAVGPRPDHPESGPPRPVPSRPTPTADKPPGPVPQSGPPVPQPSHPVPQSGPPVPQPSHPVPQSGPPVPQPSHPVPQPSHPVPQPSPQAGPPGQKPRPTPTPRPRPTPAPGAGPVPGSRDAAAGHAPGEQPARNGVFNRDKGGQPSRGDEPDGGRPAFGGGAR
jgi:syndecan 1